MHSTTGEVLDGETNTDPLGQSQWSIGKRNDWIYMDFEILPDETVLFHAALDYDSNNTCEDVEQFRVPVADAAQAASDMVNRMFGFYRDTHGGRSPDGIQRARNFIRAVQEATLN